MTTEPVLDRSVPSGIWSAMRGVRKALGECSRPMRGHPSVLASNEPNPFITWRGDCHLCREGNDP